MPSIDEILASMDKDKRLGFLLGEDVEITRLETPSISMTKALNGGWKMGHQNMIWGTKSAGKSTFCMQQIAIAQQQGMSCAYFDVEGTFDKEWTERLGVDNKELIYVDSKSMNNMVDKGVDLMKAGIDVMIVDSISALIPPAFEEKDGESKDMSGTGAQAALARGLSIGLSLLNKENRNTMLLLVSQHRSGPKGMMWGMGHTGGNAPLFYSTAVVKMSSNEGDGSTIMGDVVNGDLVINKSIGRKVDFKVQFNKGGPQGVSGKYDLYYDGDFVGIDTAGELVDMAVSLNVIRKAGSWYSFRDESLGQGRDNVAVKVRNDDELMEAVKKEIGHSG